jgi:ComF family protein
VVLDAPLDGPVCAGCWSRIRRLAPPLCRSCGDPLPSWRIISAALTQCPACRRHRPPPITTRSAGEYEGTLRDILQAFKYEGRRRLARPLGGLLRDAGADLLQGADCVVPVPLHVVRRIRRGFNQADDLARQLGLPVRRALWRVRATPAQAGLAAQARRRNVRHAFAVSPFLSRDTRAAWLTDRIVVLVDDVRTTGATLNACAEVLLKAGAREVRGLTVARATLTGRSKDRPLQTV